MTITEESIVGLIVFGTLYLYACSGDISRLLKGNKIYEHEITIPESESEYASVYPICDKCGYHILKECPGDKKVFSEIFKPTDVERLKPKLNEYFGKR
ncbi:MAG: hypothetical protein PHW84_01980 [Methanosarcina sp.]|nr:hypothetical protein [Methanosarcina sp.]